MAKPKNKKINLNGGRKSLRFEFSEACIIVRYFSPSESKILGIIRLSDIRGLQSWLVKTIRWWGR